METSTLSLELRAAAAALIGWNDRLSVLLDLAADELEGVAEEPQAPGWLALPSCKTRIS